MRNIYWISTGALAPVFLATFLAVSHAEELKRPLATMAQAYQNEQSPIVLAQTWARQYTAYCRTERRQIARGYDFAGAYQRVMDAAQKHANETGHIVTVVGN